MKKTTGSLMFGALVLGGMSFGVLSDAAVTVDPTTGQVSSDAMITVNEGTPTPTPPESVNQPDGTTGQLGPLSIDQVITFDFQDMSLSGSTQNIALKASTPQNVQVTDVRGTGAGWNLQIKQSELVDTMDSSKVLKGAYIKMVNGVVTPGMDNVNADKMPTLDTYQADATNKTNFQKISTASAGNGMGTWKVFYNQTGTDDIQLVVPSGNLLGDYQGTVTWALSDSPTANPA